MYNRRQFLHSSVGLFATVALPRALRAAPSNENLSLGFGNYGMKALPLTEAVGISAGIGYRNFEFSLYPGYVSAPEVMSAADRRATVRLLRECGMTASCLKLRPVQAFDVVARQQSERQLRAAAHLALDLAVPVPPLLAVHVGGKTNEWDGIKDQILDKLGGWTDLCAKLGVILAIKAHVGNAVDRPERVLWLVEHIGSNRLKVVFDYSHFWLIGLDLVDCLHLLQPHTVMIQVKDARHVAGGNHAFLLPGDGGQDFDYVAYFHELDRLSFAGPVVVEVSAQLFNRPGYEPVKAARHSYRTLSFAQASRRTVLPNKNGN